MPRLRPPSIVFGASPRPRTARVVGATPTPDVARGAPQTSIVEDAAQTARGLFVGERREQPIAPEQARLFADTNEWARACIAHIVGRVASADRAIVPLDGARPFDPALQARLTFLIENPNPAGDSWRSFSERWLEDLLVLAKGGFEHVRNFRGWPLALVPFDARYMHVRDWDGSDPHAPRYQWRPPGRAAVDLTNDEVTLPLLHPTTHRREGWGPLATLKETVEADAAGNAFIRSMLQKHPPPGWIHLGPRSTRRQVQSIASQLSANVLGRGGLLVTGELEKPEFINLWPGTSKDQQLQEWSQWFGRKVAISFNLSPQDIGLTFDINRATSETQQDISTDGVKIILLLVEEYVNREVVAKYGVPERVNLAFRFKELSARDRLRLATVVEKLAGGVPTWQLNELRVLQDLPPIAGGNVILAMTAQGAVPVLGVDAASYHAEQLQQVADQEDEEAQDGEEPAVAVADDGVTAEQEDNAGSTDPDAEEVRAFVRRLLDAYWRVRHGRVDYRQTCVPAEAASAARFVAAQLVERRAAGVDLADPAACRVLARYERRVQCLVATVPATPVAAYDLLDVLLRAA